MIKTIALLKRKPGMTHEQFVDCYENRHAPFIRAMLPETISTPMTPTCFPVPRRWTST